MSSTTLGADASPQAERAVRTHVGGHLRRGHLGLAARRPRTRSPDALPDTPPGTGIRRPVALGEGRFVAGDHRDTASLQGALVSGRRVAAAVEAELSR